MISRTADDPALLAMPPVEPMGWAVPPARALLGWAISLGYRKRRLRKIYISIDVPSNQKDTAQMSQQQINERMLQGAPVLSENHIRTY
jgi:hypothetical protein